MEMTSSPSCNLIPRTPEDVRPTKRLISVTLKRIDLPMAEVNRMSSFSEQTRTSTMPSPSSGFIAIFPPRLTRLKSASELRLTPPERAANMISIVSQASSSSGRAMIELMVSSLSSGNRLISALPRVAGPPMGSFQTLSL